jgi:hypothetical protein
MSAALLFTASATAAKFALTSAARAGVPGTNVFGTVTGPARAPAAAMTSAAPIATASFRLPMRMLLQVQSELSHVLTVPSQ